MRKPFSYGLASFAALVGSMVEVQHTTQPRGALGLVPLPAEIELREGSFELTPETCVVTGGKLDSIDVVVRQLRAWLARATGGKASERAGPTIRLTGEKADAKLGAEGYTLEVAPGRVTIRARSAAGLFWGFQTLRQLTPTECEKPAARRRSFALPALVIRDEPRFSWRGLHLDVGRHFFSVAEVERFLDLMALHKLNTFHWHLTEDQGWRIEIKKWPKLCEVGSKRAESPKPGARNEGDGVPYGGFYTQDEVREVVAYAAARFITVVPEIEMPGHAQAAIASYPWLGNTGERVPVRTRWGVSHDVYNVDDKTFAFLDDVLTEVCELFPGRYVHVGGDECPKTQWQASRAAQRRMRAEGLANEHELQSWFIARVERLLAKKGKRLVGWDEIQEGGLPPGATMMVWRSWKYAVEAVRLGHDVVMSPTSHCYFDYYQGDPKDEPEAIGGRLSLAKVYAFEPVPAELDETEAAKVLGAQGNLWTEYIADFDKLVYMAYPRACALAETCWTPKARKDPVAFRARLSRHLLRLDALGVAYRRPKPGDGGR